MKYLLLFDIDHTLLNIRSKGKTVIDSTMKKLFNREMVLPFASLSGKTDWQIFRETLLQNGFDLTDTHDIWEKFKNIYICEFEKMITVDDVSIYESATETIKRIQQDQDVFLGLLTGNIRYLAFKKLSFMDIPDLFTFGAFGDDHWQREWLGSIALQRFISMNEKWLGFMPIIIGDSPRDIDVAKYIHGKSIAVSNGHFTMSELQNHGADLVIEHIRQLPEALKSLKEMK